MSRIFKDDFGHELRVDVARDLTGAITSKILVEKPSGVKVDWLAAIADPPTSGILLYTTKPGDLNMAGTYKCHAYIEYGVGQTVVSRYKGELFVFKVFEKFDIRQ